MGFLAFLAWMLGMLWLDHRVTKHHVQRALAPMQPNPKCRSCGKEIDGVCYELGHGADACEKCYKEIALEAGIVRPDWWDKPLHPEGQEVPKQLEAVVAPPAEKYKCTSCRGWHFTGELCPTPINDCLWVIAGKTDCPCPDCKEEDTPAFWDRMMKAPGTVAQVRASGELRAPNPRLRVEIDNPARPHRRSVPAPEMSPATKHWCMVCCRGINRCTC